MEILVAGEALFDLISKEPDRDLIQVSAFEIKEGGAPLNVAVGLSRLGNNVSFLTKLSKDRFGERLLSFLKMEGVDTKYILVDEDVYVPLAFVSLTRGIPDFVFYDCRASYSNIKVEEIERFDFSYVKLFHFGSIVTITEPTYSTLLWIFNRLKDRVLTSFDPNIRASLIADKERYVSKIQSVMEEVDILKMSEEDAKYMFSSRDVSYISKLLKREGKITILTQGERGATLYYKGDVLHTNAYSAGKVIDTTGCGDAFMAGFIHMILKSGFENLKEALQFAAKVAGIVATRRGAAKAMPTLEEISQ